MHLRGSRQRNLPSSTCHQRESELGKESVLEAERESVLEAENRRTLLRKWSCQCLLRMPRTGLQCTCMLMMALGLALASVWAWVSASE